MKTILITSLFVFSSANALPLGGQLISNREAVGTVYLECKNMEESPCKTAMIVTEVNGVKTPQEHLTVPMGNDFDQYAERWGVFNEVSTEASILMPQFPEARYLLLVNLSMKNYREAFKVLEDSSKLGESFSMRPLFLEKLIQAIQAPLVSF